ncbi:MAG: hypothetical protein ACPHYG_01020, partial [Flavobacteriales bacterium]
MLEWFEMGQTEKPHRRLQPIAVGLRAVHPVAATIFPPLVRSIYPWFGLLMIMTVSRLVHTKR